MATKPECLGVIRTLRAAYPNYTPKDPQAMVEVYTRKMEPLQIQTLKAATEWLIEQNKFFPSVSEILKAVNEHRRLLSGNTGPQVDYPACFPLQERLIELKDAREPDREAWAQLAREFVAINHIHMARCVMVNYRRMMEAQNA